MDQSYEKIRRYITESISPAFCEAFWAIMDDANRYPEQSNIYDQAKCQQQNINEVRM